jgi:cysteine desulfurase/selenocysteine lyase
MSTAATESRTLGFDPLRVRAEFPILAHEVRGKPLAFLDTAASAQKPQVVIDTVAHTYEREYANVHRGVYTLSARASAAYEGVRAKVRGLINAACDEEIVFVGGTTEGINLIAQSWGTTNLGPGDEVLVTEMEHHSNIVPWQLLRDRTGCALTVAPMNERGELIMEEFEKLLTERTKLVAVTHVSNALGTVLPIARIAAMAHGVGAKVMIDGAQGIPHERVDVRELNVDFYVFSGHKLYGPTGTGVVYGKAAELAEMPPWQGGGDMIRSVTFAHTDFAEPPHRFEAGTPNIAGIIGMGAAIDWFMALDRDGLEAHERAVLDYAAGRLAQVPGLKVIGTAQEKSAVISFVLDYAHPHDVGTVLDEHGVAVRTGHHCAQPVMAHFGVPATIRASFGAYSTTDDVDALIDGLARVQEIFG